MFFLTISDSWLTSNPATDAAPELGLDIPINIFIAVVFPAPLAPKKPKISPLATSNEMVFTAVKSPKVLVRLRTDMIVDCSNFLVF